MRVSFGSFTVDSGARVLLDEDRPVHLSPKAFDVLQLLLDRRPDVVRKEQILATVWPDTFVGDAALSVVVAEIRRAIRDEAKTPDLIRTVHRVGYAFCGRVSEVSTPAPMAAASRCWLVLGERTFALTAGVNLVGRDPQSTIWLDEPGISRRHAAISVGAGGATIEDLGSKNGTYVRDRKVKDVRALHDGDEVRFGSIDMRFRIWSDDRPPETVPIRRPR